MLLLALSLAAIPAWAEPPALKIATWNLGWLTARPAGDPALPHNVKPAAEADIALLARYATALDADVVAFQGIDGPDLAARLFPPERYTLQLSDDAVLQRVGFAVRRGVAAVPEPDLAALDPNPYARFHLRRGVVLRLGDGTRLLAVHLKSGCRDAPLDSADRPACTTLAQQAAVLAQWIAQATQAGAGFVVLGDFGRVMDGADDFLARMAGDTPLLRATAGRASPCWGGSAFTDHILVGGPARARLQPDSLRVMVYRETGEAWRTRLPAHCPVSIRLSAAP